MTNAHITEIELQERLAEMAQRSIKLNGLQEQMTVINDNLNKSLDYINTSTVDLVFVTHHILSWMKRAILMIITITHLHAMS